MKKGTTVWVLSLTDQEMDLCLKAVALATEVQSKRFGLLSTEVKTLENLREVIEDADTDAPRHAELRAHHLSETRKRS